MAGTTPIDEDAVYRKIAWRLLPLLMLAWLFAYIDRVNIGFAKLQMTEELGFSDFGAAYSSWATSSSKSRAT